MSLFLKSYEANEGINLMTEYKTQLSERFLI